MIIRLMILLLLGFYIVMSIREGRLTIPSSPLALPLLIYLSLAGLSVIISPYTNQSLQWLVVLVGYAALLYLSVSVITAWSQVAALLMALVGMGLFEAGWALIQAGWFKVPRPSGTFFNPNFLAGYLAAIWTIVLGWVCYCRGSRGSWRERIGDCRTVSTAILVFLLVAVIWTGSRGGMLAMVVGAVLVVGMRFGRKGMALLMLGVLLCLFTPNPLRERLQAEHIANPESYSRWHMWQSSMREMGEHPFGVGLGLYQYLYPRYAFPLEGEITRYGKVAQTAHNEYVQMGVELGWGGPLVFLWGILMVAREARAILRRRLMRWQRGALAGVSGGGAVILTHAAVDANLHEPAIAILLTLCVGIMLTARQLTARKPAPPRLVPIKSRLVWTCLAVILLGGLTAHVVRLGAAWMFHESGSRALAQQDFATATSDFQTAVRLDQGKALYHSSLAAAQFRMFERARDMAAAQAAVDELQMAGALNPLDGRLHALLGYVYASLADSVARSSLSDEQRMGWLRAAVLAYERAVEAEPFAPFHCLELGRLHAALGDREQAEVWVRRAIALEPNFLPGREWLAKRYLAIGRVEAAEREYREIVERQQRYAGWRKNDVEGRFLAADAAGLAAALNGMRPQG